MPSKEMILCEDQNSIDPAFKYFFHNFELFKSRQCPAYNVLDILHQAWNCSSILLHICRKFMHLWNLIHGGLQFELVSQKLGLHTDIAELTSNLHYAAKQAYRFKQKGSSFSEFALKHQVVQNQNKLSSFAKCLGQSRYLVWL